MKSERAIQEQPAPGWPGIQPRWTSSAKDGVGTSINADVRVWFTHSHGILNEIYYPDVDQACTRDLGMLITDGKNFFSEEKRQSHTEVEYLAKGVPAYHLTNTCNQGRYRIEKEIIASPRFNAVLQRTKFVPLKGELKDFHLYALLAPHLKNRGTGNTAWLGNFKGRSVLFAQREDVAIALVCSASWLKRSVGFVGTSDGWQDLMQHGAMTWQYTRAENGNVALTGEIDLKKNRGAFVLAVGFGQSADGAASRQSQLSKQVLTMRLPDTPETGKRGRKACSILTVARRVKENSTGRARQSCMARNPNRHPEGLLPVFPFRGALRKETMISAAITWFGREIWLRPPAHCWRQATSMAPGEFFATFSPPNCRTVTGRRICGFTVRRTGMGFRWMKLHSRSCSPKWHTAKRH